MLKIGVLGAGHLGKIHLKLLKEIPDFQLIGFHDLNETKSLETEKELAVKYFFNEDELIDAVDAVDIVTPTVAHYECAVNALKKSRHIFIEKPLTQTLHEAKQLVALVHEANVKAQVGHVERFNPAFLAVKDSVSNPMFIEAHRLAEFNPRGTDVAVILDLMIHDIDIVLSLVKSAVKRVSASGVSVISETPDIANARIEFDNGCVANLTASRISLKKMRKMRLFQKDAYISIDFSEKKSEVISLTDSQGGVSPFALEIKTGKGDETKVINFNKPQIKEINSIKLELEMFAQSILNDKETPVTIEDGHHALQVALQILNKMKKN